MTGAQPFEPTANVPRAFDGGRLDRMTVLGLAVAALGWMTLVAAIAFADRLAQRDLATTPGRFHADVVAIAVCLIGSGFALAVIGTLRTGFGALNRFFVAALDRSASRVVSATTTPQPTRADVSTSESPAVERRPYSILADGSVEVETILGTRRFASMAEARDFI